MRQCSLFLYNEQGVTEQKDETLQLLNNSFQGGEKKIILLITRQNNDMQEYSTDLNITKIKIEIGTQISSSLSFIEVVTYKDDSIKSESCFLPSQETQEIIEKKDVSLQIDPWLWL